MKKILFIIGCVVTIILIYFINVDKDILYFSVTDRDISSYNKKIVKHLKHEKHFEDYILYQNDSNYRIIDLISDINNNKKMGNYTMDNLLVKSELIVLNIGHNDIEFYKFKDKSMYKYINEFTNDLDDLLNLIRKYTKENIILVFDYNINKEYSNYLYDRMLIKANKYDVKLISKKELLKYIKNVY